MSIALSMLMGIALILLITVATGYFVAQEFGFMSVDRSRLNARAAAGDKVAERTLKVTNRTSFMLSGAQLGITVTGLMVGYVAEPLVGSGLGKILGGVGVPTGVGVAVGTVLALAFSTLVQMVFGELFPKNLAIARPEPVARALARSTIIYLRLGGWLIRIFDGASNLLLRALRTEPVHDVEHSATARDLEHIVAESAASGDLPPELSLLLDRVLDFPESDAEHAMVPRVQVGTVDYDTDLAGLRETMSTGHSRYPVLDADDRVLGVVHLVDVLAVDPTNAADITAATLARPALFVPTTMTLPMVLQELARTRNQLACVLDEYGGLDGVITFEDLAEELVGEITDEHDEDESQEPTSTESGEWVMPGDTHIDEVERALGQDLPSGDYETVSGLVIAEHGRLPGLGAVIEVTLEDALADDEDAVPVVVRFTVEDIDHHVPSSVKVELVVAPDESETGEGQA